eukprot:8059816-Heterocapsa_arctica.AAC.1
MGLGQANTFEFFIECSTTHYAMVFDRIMERLNGSRGRQDYTIIDEINQTTKANIMQSILGLGQIYRLSRNCWICRTWSTIWKHS